MSALLELEDVTVVVQGRTLCEGVCLTLEASEICALAGPSGSGKSSLLRVVLGLTAPSLGTVRLRGIEVSRDGRVLVPPDERRLAVVFQELALFPHLSVHGNLAFGLDARGVAAEDREVRVRDALAQVELGGYERRWPTTLSGGERQRVAIARALVLEPDLVLFDEPLASLDVALKAEMLDLLRDALAQKKTAALYVTHDAREAARLGARIAVLEAGRITQSGRIGEIAADPRTAFVRAFVES